MLLGWGGRTDKEREKRVCLPLRLKKCLTSSPNVLAYTVQFITPFLSTCASSPNISRSKAHTIIRTIGAFRVLNFWCPIFAASTHFCNSSSVNHRAVRASRDVRLGELRLPLIKILVCERRLHSTPPRHACTSKGQHAGSPEQIAAQAHHKGTSIITSNKMRFLVKTVPAFCLM